MTARAIPLATVFAACAVRAAPSEPPAIPRPGIAVAIYSTYAVVDDRRRIEVRDGELVLEHVDATVPLHSLVIEPLGDALAIGSCTRERARGMRPPPVRCRVRGRAGEHFVRIHYATTAFAVRAEHEITLATAERATLATRFAITAPPWADGADAVLHAGSPGDADPPRELARGKLALDGSAATLVPPPRAHAARLRAVYDGAERDDTIEPHDLAWGGESRRQVWVWLELAVADPARFPHGPARIRVAIPGMPPRTVEIAADLVRRQRASVAWPVWIDDDLLGARQRVVVSATNSGIVEQIELAVTNLGEQSREVWLEERLRPLRVRTVTPSSLAVRRGTARAKLVVAPGATERVAVTIAYER